MPVEARIMIPLVPLPDVIAHEQQLLARVTKHVTVEQPCVCEFPPCVAGHFAEYGAFAVNYLVVRKWQDKILGERIRQAEQNTVVVISAVDRIFRHVVQRVMHPAHVPLEAESKPAEP